MLNFEKLWLWHPANRGIINPCTTSGKVNFENQCAIRMADCLSKVGVQFNTFKGAKCYPGHNHNQSHVLRAEELADWMKSRPQIFGRVDVKKAATSLDYKNKKGILFLLNFWGQGNQGDHIDLWNGNKMTRGAPEYFTRAEEVWFWGVK
jgi:hypothetical protein